MVPARALFFEPHDVPPLLNRVASQARPQNTVSRCGWNSSS